MRIAVVYLRVIKQNDPHFPYRDWERSTRRFLDTYQRFRPSIPHDLIIVNRGTPDHDGLFDCVATRYIYSTSTGYDIGAYQEVAEQLDHDFVLFCNSHAHFWKSGWLERFAEEFERHGEGVYGATGSFEWHPHIRTTAIGMPPKWINTYPIVTNRDATFYFEGGPENFSLTKTKCRVVTWDGCYMLADVGLIHNGFRNGDQSNVMVWDRYTEMYFNDNPQDKASSTARTRIRGGPNGKVITFSACKRAWEARDTLAALGNCHGADQYKLIAVIDRMQDGYLNEEVLSIIQTQAWPRDIKIAALQQHGGANGCIKTALSLGFQESDYVIHIEDDVMVAPDTLQWFEHAKQFSSDKSIFTVTAWRHPDGWLPESGRAHPEEEDFAYRREQYFTCWGWATWKDRWQEMETDWTTVDDHTLSWDVKVEQIRNGRVQLCPLISRAENIGTYSGTHRGDCRVSYWANRFTKCLPWNPKERV
jgi:hypothetical protein